jgi:N6-adenosine-specific RNA methylase IME4
MMTRPIRVDPEIRDLVSPLTDDELAQLEANLVAEGCRDPLVVWDEEGVLLDGHNRLEVCERRGLAYQTVRLSFAERRDALAWVIRNQFGRRNLTPYTRAQLALKLEPLVAAKAKANQRAAGGALPQKSAEPVETRREVAKAAGLSHDTIARVKVIEERAAPEIKAKLAAGEATINAVYRDIKREKKREEDASRPALPLPQGVFDLLYCDPPWQYDHAATPNRAVENQYSTLTVDELCALQPPAAKDCVLFMWATPPNVLEALAVIEAWGFIYKTHLVWDSKRFRKGPWLREQHELLLVATKGHVSPPTVRARPASLFSHRRGRHGAKPVAVYEMLERMLPRARRCELFGRTKRPRWSMWSPDVGQYGSAERLAISEDLCRRPGEEASYAS